MPVPKTSDAGLSTDEAHRRLSATGPNSLPDTAARPMQAALGKFWAPVPWLLEAAVVLQIALGDYVEAAVTAGLLLFNAALGLLQESRAQATLAALRSRLALTAVARRDGAWVTLPSADLVPGDTVKLSLGCVVAADVILVTGDALIDQSMLTGESIPVEAAKGFNTYAGALVRRGEAIAEVTATGPRTKFGRTAELVRTAHVVSSQQKAVLKVVRNLGAFSGTVIVALIAYAYALGLPLLEIVPLVLTAVLASIPAALPATFTLATALGARALAKVGVLPTRLSAVDEAATMDVLCVDKTGTLTSNALSVAAVHAAAGLSAAHVLAFAALASSDGGQDPVDSAIRAAAKGDDDAGAPTLQSFTPFDPATKMSSAIVSTPAGEQQRVVKGAFTVVSQLTGAQATLESDAEALEADGSRVLAVAAGPPAAMVLIGLIALSDPPRSDSAELVSKLRSLGVRTVMVTGDAPATASVVAAAVGLRGPVCLPGPIPHGVTSDTFAVFAGVLPEDKYKLVKAFQAAGHVVGMCGDGANDAPALRQAQFGMAVSTATDVAKSAAGMVLTEPGLVGIVAAVTEGRLAFQRIQTYALNSIIKKIVTMLVLVAGLLLTGHALITPMLMIILLIAGDFLAMSLTTDHVEASSRPNTWRIGRLTAAGTLVGACLLAFCVSVVVVGQRALGLGIEPLRTLTFLALVFGSQATIYAIRDRRHLWRTIPSAWLIASSAADIAIAASLAITGTAMAPLPAGIVGGTLAAALAFALAADLVKLPIFARLDIT